MNRIWKIVAVIAGAMLLVGCQRAAPIKRQHANTVMGTTAELTVWAPDEASAKAALAAGWARLEDVNRLMSTYQPASEVSRLNAAATGEAIVVSSETFYCLQGALKACRQSGGAFDVTCRPLVELWKQAGRRGVLPTDSELAATRAVVGPDKLKLDAGTRSVTPVVGGVQVDLGGVAKGYALDLAAQAMRAAGALSGLVDVGGDVVVLGPQPDGSPWRIGVRHPLKSRLEHDRVLALTQGAVATSGIQERYVEIQGRRFSHIVDPRTGWPAEQAPQVTVIGPDGLTADAWATAFSVLTIEEGQALLVAQPELALAVLWMHVVDGELVAVESPGFAAHVVR